MAVKAGDAFVELGVKDRQFNTRMQRAKRTLVAIGRQFAIVGAAAAAAGAVVTRAFAKQEQAEKDLEAAIRSRGQAVGELLPKLKAEARAIQSVTTAGDENTLALQAQLLNLGLMPSQMSEATRGAIGLAKALQLDANAAARYTALALQGEFTILQRYVPALRQATSEAEKQKIVMDLMNRGFAQAVMATDTVGGRFTQLKNTLGDLGEAFGAALTGQGSAADALLKIRIRIEQVTESFNQLAASSGLRTFNGILGSITRKIEEFAAFVGAISAGSGVREAFEIAKQVPRDLAKSREQQFNQIKEATQKGETVGGLEGAGAAAREGAAGAKAAARKAPAFVGFEQAIKSVQASAQTKDKDKIQKEQLNEQKKANDLLRKVVAKEPTPVVV